MNLSPLLSNLADGGFHSGEALGKSLGISRSAVWKQINALKSLGIEVHSVTGKGYRMPEPMILLNRDSIIAALQEPANQIKDTFTLHLTTGSTNTDAMKMAHAGHERYLVLAEHQTQGKGRRGRQWVSPLGRNLYMSLVWSFQSGVAALEGLSLMVALSVVRALRKSGHSGLKVKWPNDVLANGSKLAGILLEIHGDVSGPCQVVIGIGVNINMPKSDGLDIDQPYSDLSVVAQQRAHTDKHTQVIDRNSIVAALINELFLDLERFVGEGFAPYKQEWESLDIYMNKEVEVSSGANSIIGTVKGVDRGGAMLLNTPAGMITVSGGEVFPSVRPAR